MAGDYYKLVGSTNPANWTTEVVLERNDQGEVTKAVRVGEPQQLNQEDRDKLESLGFTVEKSSASEAKEVEESAGQQPGSDIAGAAPVFGSVSQEDNESGSGKDRK